MNRTLSDVALEETVASISRFDGRRPDVPVIGHGVDAADEADAVPLGTAFAVPLGTAFAIPLGTAFAQPIAPTAMTTANRGESEGPLTRAPDREA
jgi:hypothetical protein